jgi:hypothetical protein
MKAIMNAARNDRHLKTFHGNCRKVLAAAIREKPKSKRPSSPWLRSATGRRPRHKKGDVKSPFKPFNIASVVDAVKNISN